MTTLHCSPRLVFRAFAAASCLLAATIVQSSPAEHVGINAERGDPARWYVPASTPALLYETQVKEARAALGEAQKECRALQAGRTDCLAEAQAQYRHDMADARRQFETGRSGGK